MILSSSHKVCEWVTAFRAAHLTIGFVPTMGALHQGHMVLVKAARRTCDKVMVSIFVNPLQFGPNEDFNRYPRTFDEDCDLCRRHGVDIVYHGDPQDFYPEGFSTKVRVDGLTEPLCGQGRPGHFEGVTTVVAKLLLRARPTRAFFGEKDFQQAQVIKRMVRDLDIPVQISLVPIVRESDGLAVSSRNRYLSPADRKSATCLYRGLCEARERWQGGEQNAGRLKQACRDLIQAEPNASIEYIEAARTCDLFLYPDDAEVSPPWVLALAVRFDKTRLIDNAHFTE